MGECVGVNLHAVGGKEPLRVLNPLPHLVLQELGQLLLCLRVALPRKPPPHVRESQVWLCEEALEVEDGVDDPEALQLMDEHLNNRGNGAQDEVDDIDGLCLHCCKACIPAEATGILLLDLE